MSNSTVSSVAVFFDVSSVVFPIIVGDAAGVVYIFQYELQLILCSLF